MTIYRESVRFLAILGIFVVQVFCGLVCTIKIPVVNERYRTLKAIKNPLRPLI
jgi:hypothetical protein